MTNYKAISQSFERGEGILNLIPNFVPRKNSEAGRRLKLHPDDYFALGLERGSIKERWFSSVLAVRNGPLAPPDEGMSYVNTSGEIEDKVLFKDFVDTLGAHLIGHGLAEQYGTWPMYSKFYDYNTPLFHHVHPRDMHAKLVGRAGKPEAYYFPPQLNNHLGLFPHTYFGFDPDVSKGEVKDRLSRFMKGDNRITELSRAFRLELGTGWYTPPGVIHAPGSLLTYEPQWNADIKSVFQNVQQGEIFPPNLLTDAVPEDKREDLDFIMELLDWEKNVDPHYRKNYFRRPVLASESEGHIENWVCYATGFIAAKELTVAPGSTVVVKDQAAYGCILTQGHGSFGIHEAEAPIMLRYGQLTADEFFVSEQAAVSGVTITNKSGYEPLVILKHFGPNAGDPTQEQIGVIN